MNLHSHAKLQITVFNEKSIVCLLLEAFDLLDKNHLEVETSVHVDYCVSKLVLKLFLCMIFL